MLQRLAGPSACLHGASVAECCKEQPLQRLAEAGAWAAVQGFGLACLATYESQPLEPPILAWPSRTACSHSRTRTLHCQPIVGLIPHAPHRAALLEHHRLQPTA